MRTLATLSCPSCGRFYYGDLPSGFGLHYPMLLDAMTGEVHDMVGALFFAEWMRTSYAQRSDRAISVDIIGDPHPRRPLLLNCLDGLYGHGLLKLLNAQRHLDHEVDFDLVVIAPRHLQWLVPAGVAATWVVDLPLAEGWIWSDALAKEFARLLEPMPEAWLSLTRTHPAPTTYNIERFTRVEPKSLAPKPVPHRPVVTFIWRHDRPWVPERWRPPMSLRHTRNREIIALARRLRTHFGDIDFAVVGIGHPGCFPPDITDLRVSDFGLDEERRWCERYAASDVVIGVHGSNMLLPSAHAAITIELEPPDRLGHVGQSLLPRGSDTRDVVYRYRPLPLGASPDLVADVAYETLRWLSGSRLNFVYAEQPSAVFEADPLRLVRLRQQTQSAMGND